MTRRKVSLDEREQHELMGSVDDGEDRTSMKAVVKKFLKCAKLV